jgi:hypothetical protein
MDSNIDENCSVILKSNKIGPVLWFTENRSITIKKL